MTRSSRGHDPSPDAAANVGIRITVVVPTYGTRGGMLLRALKSIDPHRRDDLEVLVVDDCTPDESVRDVATLAGATYVRRPTNGGVAAAQQLGVEEAQGRYVVFLHSDDQMAEARTWSVLPNGIVVGALSYGPDVQGPHSLSMDGLIWHHYWVHISACTFDKQLLVAHPFDSTLRSWEDWDLLFRLAISKVPISLVDEVFAYIEVTGIDRLSATPAMALALPYIYCKHAQYICANRQLRALWEFKMARLSLRAGARSVGYTWLARSLLRDPLHPRRWNVAAKSLKNPESA